MTPLAPCAVLGPLKPAPTGRGWRLGTISWGSYPKDGPQEIASQAAPWPGTGHSRLRARETRFRPAGNRYSGTVLFWKGSKTWAN